MHAYSNYKYVARKLTFSGRNILEGGGSLEAGCGSVFRFAICHHDIIEIRDLIVDEWAKESPGKVFRYSLGVI